LAGTLVSHTGDLVQSMAVSWLVFQLTHSALKLGLIGFCWMLPRLLFGVVGGVIADRVDRRRLLIGTQVVAMLQSMACFALVVTGVISYSHLVVLTLVLGVADSLHFTARHALVAALVPPTELQAAVALHAAAVNVTQVIGPSLGGLLIGLVGISGCLLANVVSFAAILGALLLMRWRPTLRPVHRPPMAAELVEGLRYVAAREALWVPTAIAYGVAALAMAFTRLLPVFATDVLHAGVRGYGWLQTAPGVGAIVASLAVAARGRYVAALRRVYGSVLALVGALAVFAVAGRLALSLAALVIVGGAQMVFRTTAIAACHEATDDAHRGRVISIFLLDYGLWSFGTLWLGWLCDARGPTVAVLTGAGSCLAVTAVVAWIARRRRQFAFFSA
jgi:MFS family permease